MNPVHPDRQTLAIIPIPLLHKTNPHHLPAPHTPHLNTLQIPKLPIPGLPTLLHLPPNPLLLLQTCLILFLIITKHYPLYPSPKPPFNPVLIVLYTLCYLIPTIFMYQKYQIFTIVYQKIPFIV